MSRTIKHVNTAKKAKKDEFYTQLEDIEKEMIYHKDHFKNSTIYCNCDNPNESNFFKYFHDNFKTLKLKKLITTHWSDNQPVFKREVIKNKKNNDLTITDTPLKGDGSFDSQECLDTIKEADIVITNPPFSLFRLYFSHLIKSDKKFLIIGSLNASGYKDIFPLLKEGKIWMGNSIKSGDREFRVPDDYPLQAQNNREDEDGNKFIRVTGVRWYTNLDYQERHSKQLPLVEKYIADNYPKYDNYDAINVDRLKLIPKDYYKEIGVPITFFDKHNPEQFEIMSFLGTPVINNKTIYKRVIVKRIRKS